MVHATWRGLGPGQGESFLDEQRAHQFHPRAEICPGPQGLGLFIQSEQSGRVSQWNLQHERGGRGRLEGIFEGARIAKKNVKEATGQSASISRRANEKYSIPAVGSKMCRIRDRDFARKEIQAQCDVFESRSERGVVHRDTDFRAHAVMQKGGSPEQLGSPQVRIAFH
jgi:hypothetical protein